VISRFNLVRDRMCERPLGKVARVAVFAGPISEKAFNATDKVGAFYVFAIGGNKFRLIAAVHFNVQKLYVRHVFTHKEYNQWKP
jgi:mRNA-degrading endonuclease HigB of HigAB toxin-antitoxin module